MNDLIRRQDAIDACLNGFCACVSDCVDEIEKLPSALNFPKIGKWEEIDIKDYKAKCSSCGTWSPIMGKYCPHCGARMIGEEE